jgi:hypothetical protein
VSFRNHKAGSMVGLVLATFLLIGAAGQFAAATVAKPFRITKLVLPKYMIENGPSKNMSVYWQGTPTFPVTMYIAEPSCAENVTCNSGHLRIAHKIDPIVWHKLWKCVGNVSSTEFSYNFWMVDAKGVKTQKVPADVLCKE